MKYLSILMVKDLNQLISLLYKDLIIGKIFMKKEIYEKDIFENKNKIINNPFLLNFLLNENKNTINYLKLKLEEIVNINIPKLAYYYISFSSLNFNEKEKNELEKIISNDSYYSYIYATSNLKNKRFILGEPKIANSKWAIFYAKEVIGGRFELAEPYIMKSSQFSSKEKLQYKNYLKEKGIDINQL